MLGGDRDLDTICAISTPPGVGGLHIIRISGPKAQAIVRPNSPFLPEKLDSHRVYFGTFVWNKDVSQPIDEVVITYFQKGRSFTGEETLEVTCHGSVFVAERLLKTLIAGGARLADRGEFTYRAFMNGRLDLVQAEGVLALIQSESQKAAEIALFQLKGELSSHLRDLKGDLLALLARLEISIDFTTEDIEIIPVNEVKERLKALLGRMSQLLKTFKVGQKIRSGFEVALVGQPNVGKSSLLNRVLGVDRAIVTEIPGTTRDVLHDEIVIKGVKVVFSDTAGIRETQDIVEKIGVERSLETLQRADLILVVFDCSQPDLEFLGESTKSLKNKVIFVGNKLDLVRSLPGKSEDHPRSYLRRYLGSAYKFQTENELESFLSDRCIFVSSLDKSSKETLIKAMETHLDVGSLGHEGVLSQVRHYENLQRSFECLTRADQLNEEGVSPEFLTFEIKEALIRVQEILGERFDDQILDRVFSEFCIGK